MRCIACCAVTLYNDPAPFVKMAFHFASDWNLRRHAWSSAEVWPLLLPLDTTSNFALICIHLATITPIDCTGHPDQGMVAAAAGCNGEGDHPSSRFPISADRPQCAHRECRAERCSAPASGEINGPCSAKITCLYLSHFQELHSISLWCMTSS